LTKETSNTEIGLILKNPKLFGYLVSIFLNLILQL
jgi:hypothetical protein